MDRVSDPHRLLDMLGDWMSGRGPLYRKLADAIEHAVRAGDLDLGERLPAERPLARALAVSRATVVAAYDELRGRGVVDSRHGSGTRIGFAPGLRPAWSDGRAPDGEATALFQRLIDGRTETISLRHAGGADLDLLRQCFLEALDEDLPRLISEGGYHPAGVPGLREVIAEHYSANGLATDADQVVVTTGASQAIALAARAYLRPGRRVVVESPAWPGCLDVFRAAGARPVGIRLDEEGIRIDEAARALAAPATALLFVTPTYQNPTGVLMSRARRRRVAELADRHGVPVLEDHAHFEPGIPPIAAFARQDAEILTVGTLAKTFWSGLRIGWVRAPEAVADRLARHKALMDMGSPVVEQLAAARLVPRLAAGAAARAADLAGRHDRVRALLADRLPTWRYAAVGGSAAWIELPGADAAVFAQIALRHGVETVPGAATDPGGEHDSFLRFPVTFPDDTLEEAVARLAQAWAIYTAGRSGQATPARPDRPGTSVAVP